MADKILFQPTSTAQAIQDFYGGKNLFRAELMPYVSNGITFTTNPDTGEIIANGTNSASSGSYYDCYLLLEPGTYTLSGNPLKNTGVRLILAQMNNQSRGTTVLSDAGSGATGTVTEKLVYDCYIYIPAGTTVTNAVFKPMIRLASTSSDFKPFAPSNLDLWNRLPNDIPNSLSRIGRNLTERLSTTLYDEIYTGNFSNIKPGDYIIGPSTGTKYFIAHRDPFYGFYSGTDRIGSVAAMHHVAIWPATHLGTSQGMNATNTTEGGYWNSAGREYVDQLAEDYFVKDFGDHIKPFGSILSTATSDGLASAWEWKTGRKADLLSEINVYGSIVWGNGKQNVGIQKEQFEIFRDLGTHVYGNDYFWLKDVVNSTDFADASGVGYANYFGASDARSFRPFAILAK